MDEAEERAAIIASMFSKNKDIGDLEQTYVSHLKVWQEAGGEGEPMQCRYIVLSGMLYSTHSSVIEMSFCNRGPLWFCFLTQIQVA